MENIYNIKKSTGKAGKKLTKVGISRYKRFGERLLIAINDFSKCKDIQT